MSSHFYSRRTRDGYVWKKPKNVMTVEAFQGDLYDKMKTFIDEEIMLSGDNEKVKAAFDVYHAGWYTDLVWKVGAQI